MIVFDSSALLAYLRGEAGGDFTENLLDDADVSKFIHAVNLCEVHHFLARNDGLAVAESAVSDLRALGMIERNDLDGAFWRDVSLLLTRQRTGGHGLAFGDACGLALARRLGADFITADHAEMEPVNAAGLCSVVFIR